MAGAAAFITGQTTTRAGAGHRSLYRPMSRGDPLMTSARALRMFFAAEHGLGDVRRASWGVCRADVRKALSEGDLVVFFCARDDGGIWRYHFIGFGTVKALIGRKELWTNPAYRDYRSFYNVLARLENGRLAQNEVFYKYHPDWQHRAKAPYVIFDETASHFNLQDPHCVATWEKGASIPEEWAVGARSRILEQPSVRRARHNPPLADLTDASCARQAQLGVG